MHAWIWDWLEGQWRTAERRDLYPGQTVLVAAECGGYDPETGWAPERKPAAALPSPPTPSPEELADASQDDESLSAYPWKSIATHGRETGILARSIASELDERLAGLFDLAGRWHDAGKVFPAFQNSIHDSPKRGERPMLPELAKAPEDAWLHPARLYPMDGNRRSGFRHELVSVLALFSVLRRHRPDHPALLGPWRGLFEQMGANVRERIDTGQPPPTALEQEILALDADQFDLLAYLVCSHHGKLRVAWHAAPADQETNSSKPRLRGTEEEDQVPAVRLCDASGGAHALPGFAVSLDLAAAGLSLSFGPGWTERVLGLLRQHGPFALAWLEALLRAADQRASRDSNTTDPLLNT